MVKDNDPGGIIQAIPKGKAEDLLEIIHSGMLANNKSHSNLFYFFKYYTRNNTGAIILEGASS
ncbi:MAG: hypothetical protein ACR2IS_04490 [Nitrososphaeraceae archaeon]